MCWSHPPHSRSITVLNCGTISQASGSSYVELGSTKVMVGVYGPRQSDRWMKYSEQGSLDCDVRLATFATRQRGRPTQTQLEKELSAQLETALSASVLLHTFPKAVLDVQCLVLEAGGSVLAAVIAAATLALADASIELRDLVSAASVVRRLKRRRSLWTVGIGPGWGPCPCPCRWCSASHPPEPPSSQTHTLQSRVQGIQLLDPTAEEEYREEAGLVLSFMPCLNQVGGCGTAKVCRGSHCLAKGLAQATSPLHSADHIADIARSVVQGRAKRCC